VAVTLTPEPIFEDDSADEPSAAIADLEPTPMVPPAPFPTRAVILGLWLAGALGWWALVGVRLSRFRRLLCHAEPAPACVVDSARSLARRFGLRRVPRVEFVDAGVPPLLWALFGRPRIVLPCGLWACLDETQRESVLAHELAHLRRGDHWVRRLELVVCGLYWWHPAVWWARHRMHETEEACCDSWVLWALPASAPEYADALIEAVAFLSRPAPLAVSGAARARGLKRRLTMILKRPPARRLSWGGWAMVLVLAAGVLPWRFGRAEVAADPAPPPSSTTLPALSLPTRNNTPAPAPSPKPEADPELIQAVRDEVELLEVSVESKSVSRKAADQRLNGAKELYQIQAAANTSKFELQQTQIQIQSLMAEVAQKQAELREAEVKLRQAKRRLAVLEAKTAGPQPNPVPKPAPSPKADSDPMSIDLGEVRPEVVSLRIPIMNSDDKPLRIRRVRTSSGALTAQPVSEVPAKGEGHIDLQLDGRRFTGTKTFEVFIETVDDPTGTNLHAKFRATRPDPDADEKLKRLTDKLDAMQAELDQLRKELRAPSKRP
jgi:beta-lactamase regulating signal transducer with metallopeptidase domain